MSSERVETDVDGQRLTLSHLDKVLYPAIGFTKGQVLDYYAKIAGVMLPHVAHRAVTLRRFPDGVASHSFFEKHAPSHTPDWVQRARVPRSGTPHSADTHDPSDIEYAVVGDRATLMWAANLATLEFHVPLWRVDGAVALPGPPDALVFDLDPGPGTTIVECCIVARWIRTALERENLGPVVAKTSGSKGLQLYVPVTHAITWSDQRDRAFAIASEVEAAHPDAVVTNMRKSLRNRHVLIDWSQNHPAKTTVAAYSLRARPEPTVSTPVAWREVERCAKGKDPDTLRFVASDVLRRVAADGDLFAQVLDR